MEEQVENWNRRKLVIDWGQILPERDDDPLAELIVEKDEPPRVAPNADSDDSVSGDEIDPKFSDYELELYINRMKRTYEILRLTLKDKGDKLLRTIKRLEDERQRRRLCRAEIGCLERTIVLPDEDEYPLKETPEKSLHVGTTGQEDRLDDGMKDAKIYYPSRDDPESVEICYTDIYHLSPGAYLTSPIMNFYIRYLQQQASPTNRAIYDCHFFNTYFYKKLKEAVSYKEVDKNPFFIKFRRWWKGVNIFQKAYVLIPIHEDLHWSLVIISIPNKEEESGPIILHLDSLGLHSSRSVFDNIRSFLKEEWNYLNEVVSPSDLPIADRIWKHLACRIDEKIITVPQQKNDYDCGLFVLFFMERFIEEAPERMKKEDLAMFGKRWFRPEEASGLRVKIRNLLKEEFELAKEGCCISKSPWSSGRTRT